MQKRAVVTLKKATPITANKVVAKVKAVASPYFGVNDFAFAYARA